ncbi:hypothetical protein E0K83_06840 [Gramella sp. BOM4]|nr:hypothetical protein [Christiangramia bathymodioli]
MFKKLTLLAIFAMCSLYVQAQENESNDKPSKFGFTAGYIQSELNSEYINKTDQPIPFSTVPIGGEGLFLGVTFDAEIAKDLGVSSEFLWAFTYNGAHHWRLNTLLKYRLFSSKFHLLAGPEIKMIDSDAPNNDHGNRFGLNVTGGLEYDISNRYSVYFKYSEELTNRYNGGVLEDDYKGSYSGFRLGLKFKF